MQIQNINGTLLVDSRLVAEALGIQHESLKKTIEDQKILIEESFGILRLEIGEIVGRGQPEKYYLLTEDQATFVMTLSRNTEQVVKAKLNLVKSFSSAKKLIQSQQQDVSVILQMLSTVQNQLIQQEENMRLLTERTQRLDELEQHEREFHIAAQQHPGCADILVDQLENAIDDATMTVPEFLAYLGLDNTHRYRLAKKTSAFQKCGKNVDCPKQKGTQHMLFEVRYLKQALRAILDI